MPLESTSQQQKKINDEKIESSVSVEEATSLGADFDEEAISVNKSLEITADSVVKNHIIASLASGLIPVPLLDISALTAIQMNMMRSLSALYDVPFEDSNSKSLIISLLGGSLPVLGVVGLSSIAKLMPGIGSLVGSASLSITAGAVTYAVGQVFIMHLGKGGTLDDFNPKQAQVFFRREFEIGKAFVQDIKNEMKTAKETEKAESAGKERPVA